MRLVLDERNELREPMGTAKMTMTYGQPRNEIVPARFPAGRHIMVRRLFHKYASLRPLAGIRAGGDYPCSLPSRVSDQWAKTQAEEKQAIDIPTAGHSSSAYRCGGSSG